MPKIFMHYKLFFVHASITYWNEVKYQCKTTTNLIVSNPFWKKVSLVEQKKNTHTHTHKNQTYKGYQNKSNPTF
jgi:hypothetical protein